MESKMNFLITLFNFSSTYNVFVTSVYPIDKMASVILCNPRDKSEELLRGVCHGRGQMDRSIHLFLSHYLHKLN